MKDFYEKYYAQLIGAKILKVAVLKDEDDDDNFSRGWPTLWVEAADGKRFQLEVSRDEEGNGPGFIFGLPNPADKEGTNA
jgi:hypothetical protein